MKKLILLSLIISTSLSSASAAQKRGKNSDTITVSRSAPASRSNFRFGIGAATYAPAGTGSSVVGLFHFDQRNTLQPMFTIERTMGTFVFSTGALYRHAMSLGGNAGFHIGAAFGIGTVAASGTAAAPARTNALAVTFGGVAGLQYRLPGTDDLILFADAGPMFGLQDGDADFSLGPFSGFFGAALVYLF